MGYKLKENNTRDSTTTKGNSQKKRKISEHAEETKVIDGRLREVNSVVAVADATTDEAEQLKTKISKEDVGIFFAEKEHDTNTWYYCRMYSVEFLNR